MESVECPGWLNIESSVQLTFTLRAGLFPEEVEEHRCRRVATFDVDRPCELVTPFDSELERLPRPDFRSMSQGWIVEHVKDEVVQDGREDSSSSFDESYKAHSAAGVSQELEQASSKYGMAESNVSFQACAEAACSADPHPSTREDFEVLQASQRISSPRLQSA